jgi:hypothetical protein
VPGVEKVDEYDPPLPSVPLLTKPPSALITECGALSRFVQVTVVPAAMLRSPGPKAKPWITTLAAPPAGGGVGWGVGVGAGGAVGVGVAGVVVAAGLIVAVGSGARVGDSVAGAAVAAGGAVEAAGAVP